MFIQPFDLYLKTVTLYQLHRASSLVYSGSQINTGSLFHTLAFSPNAHTGLFVQLAVDLFSRPLNYSAFCHSPLNIEIGDEKEKQCEHSQCTEIQGCKHSHEEGMSKSEIEGNCQMRPVSYVGKMRSMPVSFPIYPVSNSL